MTVITNIQDLKTSIIVGSPKCFMITAKAEAGQNKHFAKTPLTLINCAYVNALRLI